MFRKSLLFLAIAALALIAVPSAIVAPDADAAFPGANGDFVYSREASQKSQLFSFRQAGSIETRLTNTPTGFDFEPAWSPDGVRIAFTRQDVSALEPLPEGHTYAPYRIFVINADGSGISPVTNPSGGDSDREPAWSPDGSKIIFSRYNSFSTPSQKPRLYKTNADGGAVPEQIGQGPGVNGDAAPAWAPDGQSIAFTSFGTTGSDIYLMDANGSNVRHLARGNHAVWSPDSKKVAFIDDFGQAWVIDANGASPTPIEGGRPVWSPDGSVIASIGAAGISQVPAAGGALQQVAPITGQYLDWQPIPGQCPGTASVASASTDDDTDGDNIPDNIENNITNTDPNCQDTDGDGLLDPWEVPENVEGAGFDLDGDGDIEVTRDEVFGPYAGQCGSASNGPRREPLGQNCGLMSAPDPLHKDVYVEIDWQDCFLGDCPEPNIGGQPLGIPMDPSHHAPDMAGLLDVVNMFRAAPVENPDETDGVNLNILVDQAILHTHNCDQGVSEARATSFGTAQQRRDGDASRIIQAREMVFRYGWSGHSSIKDYSPPPNESCPLPEFWEIIAAGAGVHPLPEYDLSPHGFAAAGGRDIIVSLAVSWICQLYTFDAAPNVNHTAPCFRQTIRNPLFIPGLFPGRIAQPNGGSVAIEYPIHMLLGLQPSEGIQQLWGRSFANLLGSSLGVTPGAIGNDPNTSGRSPVEGYSSWTGVAYAPPPVVAGSAVPLGAGDGFVPIMPDLSLAEQDSDGDGVIEGDDNCPGIDNPTQANLDGDGAGDGCDLDIDGDGLPNDDDDRLADTDNDGSDNDADPDDDGDSIPDSSDNCPLIANPGQENADSDAEGDACDFDSDADGLPDMMEAIMGSDPLSEDIGPEFLGFEGTCSDGLDNDGDGDTDSADDGCQDSDGDTVPTSVDNCPSTSSISVADTDGDGEGDRCEPPGEPRLWGDNDCDGGLSSRDNQALSRKVLQQPALTQTEPCPDLGDTVTVTGAGDKAWGDLDCDGDITSRDGQALLRKILQQSPLSQTQPCPEIGETVAVASIAALPMRRWW